MQKIVQNAKRFASCLLLCLTITTVNNSYANAEAYFVSLADIHFDPFNTCQSKKPCPLAMQLQQAPVSRWSSILADNDKAPPVRREDTNYTLFMSALAASKEAADKADAKFIVVLGDFISHDFRRQYRKYTTDKALVNYQAFVKKTLEFVMQQINRTFPNKDVYTVVGNNDTYYRNYESIPNSAFFKEMAPIWSALIKNPVNRNAMRESFSEAGYYAVDIPRDEKQPALRLIVMNSVLFSIKAKNPRFEQDARDEFNWLDRELTAANYRHQPVYLLMHIPPSFDFYFTQHVRWLRLMYLWRFHDVTIFQRLLDKHAQTITGMLFGHLHTNQYHYQEVAGDQEIPVSVVTSISPFFGNDPGFKVLSYSTKNDQLTDNLIYYRPLGDPSSNFEPYCYACSRENPLLSTSLMSTILELVNKR